MSIMVPVTTSEVTPRARRAPSSSVPAKPSYQRLRTTSSSGRGTSASLVRALASPSRHEDDGTPKPRGVPGGAGGCSGWSSPTRIGTVE
jgi:hypothetical protein